jgi:pre-60S factor REI1
MNSEGHAQAIEELGSDTDPDTPIERMTLDLNGAEDKHQFIPPRCLFCTMNSSAVELSVKHMQKDHGLFIPNKEYLIDLETFLKYLFTIITEFYECFYCGNTKDSTVAIRQHMISKGHCSLRPAADSEYEDFYDVKRQSPLKFLFPSTMSCICPRGGLWVIGLKPVITDKIKPR